jgi:hypothetical protein
MTLTSALVLGFVLGLRRERVHFQAHRHAESVARLFACFHATPRTDAAARF